MLNGVFIDCLSYGVRRRQETYGAKANDQISMLTHWQKLRPFFPPLTPLQSLNLRAALYRALTGLKKDGILGREILLRKTILDECKGDKFEELVSAFAMTVLRKVVKERNDAQLELACSGHLSGQQEARLLPLIIAHRRSLQQKLSQHRKLQGHAKLYSGLLAQRHALIEERRTRLSKLPVLEEGQKTGSCKDIADSWLGDDGWVEILMSGPARSTDPFLEAPFETGWKAVLEGRTIDVEQRTDLLKELNAMVANQETRLRKWKTFAASLRNTEARRQDALSEPAQPENGNSAVLQFDRHQLLHLSDTHQATRFLESHVPANSTHKILLASMEADLASIGWRNGGKLATARREAGQSRDKITAVRSTESTFIARQQVESEPPAISAPMHLRTPKDLSQIPSDTQPRQARVLVHSAAQPILPAQEQSSRIEMTPHGASSIQMDPDKHQSSFTSTKDTSTLVRAKRDKHDSEEQMTPFASEHGIIQSNLKPERTVVGQNIVRTMVPPPTLLERTRQSMSLLPKPAQKARLNSSDQQKSSKQTRLSQAFPINQFETSNPAQPETCTPRSGSSTPRDELLSDTAAYDSVFKSRPRIALSPVLSPDKSRLGGDSMSEEDLAYLVLEDDT